MNKIVLTLTIMLTIGSTAHAMQHACAMNKKQHGGKKVLQKCDENANIKYIKLKRIPNLPNAQKAFMHWHPK